MVTTSVRLRNILFGSRKQRVCRAKVMLLCIKSVLIRMGTFGSVTNQYPAGWPFLRGSLPPDGLPESNAAACVAASELLLLTTCPSAVSESPAAFLSDGSSSNSLGDHW